MKSVQLLGYYITRVLFTLAFTGIIVTVSAQGTACPPNLDFEQGNFTNWTCLKGIVEANDAGVGQNILQLRDTTPTSTHTIIPSSNRELDIYGGFPKSCPNGSGYSVLLGNNIGGHEAEGLYYTFTVPAGVTEYSITYHYAVVLQDPSHMAHQQPRFRARIIDVATDAEVDCVSFDFVSSAAIPGFRTSDFVPNVIYKDWTPVTVNLTSYAGKTLKLEFITSDCTFNAHFGYAYVDVNSNCNNSLANASLCDGDDFLTLTAPYGFKSYAWYLNSNYADMIADSIVFYANPVPPTANNYAVIVTPYTGYGCVDTFIAPVRWQPRPVFEAGVSRNVNCNDPVQLGMAGNSTYSYAWMPAEKVTNASIANPWMSKYVFTPVNYTVKVTDNITGCNMSDTVLITPVYCYLFVPTAFTPNGDGLNDVVVPNLGGTKGLKRFSIFNRSGNIVFSTTREGQAWDGTYRGAKLDPAVFVWVLEYISIENQEVVEKGTLTLIR